MPLVNLVSLRNELIIPIRSSCLVSTNEQNGSTSWIKSIKYTVRATFVLASEFAHIVESRAVNRVGVRTLQVNPKFFQQAHRKIDTFLLVRIQAVPPDLKFAGEFNLVCHCRIIP